MKFTKPPRSIEEQIQILIDRGLSISNQDIAKRYLFHSNYYRLRAYWLHLESDQTTHEFKEGATLEEAINLYEFDREFRLLILDAIERLEVSFRTQWAFQIAHLYGAHSYLDPKIYSNQERLAEIDEKLREEINRSHENFIKHYLKTYTEPELPPIWVVCEVISLGLLSKIYRNLKLFKDRTEISKQYGLDELVYDKFLQHLTYIRNTCAHHSRLWNRKLTITLKLPVNKPPTLAKNFNRDGIVIRKIYNTLVMIQYLLNIVCDENNFKNNLFSLIKKYNIDVRLMGFPNGYEKFSIWK